MKHQKFFFRVVSSVICTVLSPSNRLKNEFTFVAVIDFSQTILLHQGHQLVLAAMRI